MIAGQLRLAFVSLAGLAAGWLLSRTPMPMPWLIGPMVVTAAHGIGWGDLRLPRFARPFGQAVVAAVVGLAFTATALAAFLDHILAMLAVAAATVAFGFAAAAVLARLTRIDAISATIASVPGGPVEMSAFAAPYGVPPAPIAFVQTLRISLLVLTIPPLLVLTSGEPVDPAASFSAAERDPAGAVLLLALAAAGAVTFAALRLTSPFFLGALSFAAVASAMSLPVAAPPYWLICLAQVLLGISLGNMFDRRLFSDMRGFVMAACASTAVLVTLSTAFGLAVAAVTGIPWQTMLLAASPGSVTEMALTARLLHQDAAMVTAFHLVRIFTIMPLAPLIFAGAARAASRLQGGGR